MCYTMFNVHSNVHCTLYTVHCTVYLYTVRSGICFDRAFIIILFKLSYCNKYKSYLKLNEDFVTSKISTANLFTLLH